MSIHDRLSGATAAEPPTTCFSGQWRLSREGRRAVLRLNDCPVQPGDVLLPDATGHWSLVRQGDARPLQGTFVPGAALSRLDETAFRRLGRILCDPDNPPGGWLEWRQISPIAPELEREVKPHPLEKEIERELPHLRKVCWKPRTHIRLESQSVPVARARNRAHPSRR